MKKYKKMSYGKSVNVSVGNILLGSGGKGYKGKYPMKDYDSDKILNSVDCSPYNKKKDSIKSVAKSVWNFVSGKTTGSGDNASFSSAKTSETGNQAKAPSNVATTTASNPKTNPFVSSRSSGGGGSSGGSSSSGVISGGYSVPGVSSVNSTTNSQKTNGTNYNFSNNLSLGSIGSSNLNQGVILSQKKIDTIKDSRGNKIPVYQLQATENGKIRNATKEERDYYKSETNYLQASNVSYSPIANTKFYKGTQNIIAGFEEKTAPAVKTIRNAPDLLWFFFPKSEAYQTNLGTNQTKTQDKIKSVVKNVTSSPFYLNYVSAQGLSEKAGGNLRYGEIDISGADLSSSYFDALNPKRKKTNQFSALSESKFSSLGGDLDKQIAYNTISNIEKNVIEKATTKEQLKYLNSIRNNLKTEGSIKNFDNFVKDLYNRNVLKPVVKVNLDTNTYTSLVPPPKVDIISKVKKSGGSVVTGLFIADIKSAFAEPKSKTITYQKNQIQQNDFMNIMMGTGTTSGTKTNTREKTKEYQPSGSFQDVMLGTPQKTEPRTKQVSVPRTTQPYVFPTPNIPFRNPKFPGYWIPRKPQKAYSYQKPTRSGRTKTNKRAYAPSLSAYQLTIQAPKGYSTKKQFSGLEIRPLVSKTYYQNLTRAFTGKTMKSKSAKVKVKKYKKSKNTKNNYGYEPVKFDYGYKPSQLNKLLIGG